MRGAVIAAAALTKFAPIVLAPLFLTYGALPPRGRSVPLAGVRRRSARWPMAPVAFGDGLSTFYDRTIGFHAIRGSPFSIWGLDDLPGRTRHLSPPRWSSLVVVAFVPRRRDEITVAALGAAALIALQLGAGALVLPLPRVVLAAVVRGAVRRPQDRLDRHRARGAGRRRRRSG